MSLSQSCGCCHMHSGLAILVLFLLLSCLTQVQFTAESRVMYEVPEVAQDRIPSEETGLVKRRLIGSAPPRCERRCESCEHCEAIQVPVTTQSGSKAKINVPAAASYGRADSISNYKPISWKCKCGSFIFNP